MAYLSQFDNDVFISYSHVDNLAPGGGLGWVSRFFEALDIALSQEFGRVGTVSLWWDKQRQDGGTLFNDNLRREVNGSGLFLALVSQGLITSDYCRSERETFAAKIQSDPLGPTVGRDRARFINVLMRDVSHEEWPGELSGTTGHALFDGETGDPTDADSKAFLRQVRELAKVLRRTLVEMRPAKPVVAPTTNERRIYLGDVPDTLRPVRKRIVSELERAGVGVLDPLPPPYPAAEHDAAVQATLAEALLSVHLHDAWAGRPIDDGAVSYAQRQTTLALESSTPVLVWRPAHVELAAVADPVHAEFLRSLEEPRVNDGGFELATGHDADLTRDIIEVLERRSKPGAPAVSDVLIDMHMKDQPYSGELIQHLLTRGIRPLICPSADDPSKTMAAFGDSLDAARHLIIMYGDVAAEWVRERIGAAFHHTITSGGELEACGIFLAPSARPAVRPRRFDHPLLSRLPIHWLDNSAGFDPNTLGPVLGGT